MGFSGRPQSLFVYSFIIKQMMHLSEYAPAHMCGAYKALLLFFFYFSLNIYVCVRVVKFIAGIPRIMIRLFLNSFHFSMEFRFISY